MKWFPGNPGYPNQRYWRVDGKDGSSPDIWLPSKYKETSPLGSTFGIFPVMALPYKYKATRPLGSAFGMNPVMTLVRKLKNVTLDGMAVPLMTPFNPMLSQYISITR